MSYEASTMSNNMQLAYTADGTATYISMSRPASSSSPSPTPTYNNPNGAGAGGRNTGENNSIAMVTAGMDAYGGEVVKRKRGRPRKYAPDVSLSPAARLSPPGQAAPQVSGLSSPALSSGKKPRGRPPGSLNKQQPAASGSPGVGFMPHILDVKAGEDVLAKLMWFAQNSTRALCVLSANGAVSNVTLQQSATSGGTVTYEGRFEILSLSGSFMVSETGGQRSRTGGLSVALSGSDGRVLGGNVAGLLTAASPLQVIVGSFIPASQKQTRTAGTNEAEVVNAPANLVSGTSAGGTQSESSGGGLGSPLGHSNNSNPQGITTMPWR
ncbi:AT-hook motif nuclear-localized protein 10-like [Cynara cardunculus var. scolymus]|uniref:AT-hook motif nuclear-localized protein 10-like n=1 Tax=Cynara cardunculus var. scolymus TaxID=59895 RepID=UPI000D63081A|nr:AT-hook motif nuclear-localized protein 10-like [Cynara cardunculus var. scolymus]